MQLIKKVSGSGHNFLLHIIISQLTFHNPLSLTLILYAQRRDMSWRRFSTHCRQLRIRTCSLSKAALLYNIYLKFDIGVLENYKILILFF